MRKDDLHAKIQEVEEEIKRLTKIGTTTRFTSSSDSLTM